MRIDFHTHAFPERIREKAMQSLAHNSGGIQPASDGSLDSLRRHAEENGIDTVVLLHIATNPKQQKNVNDFAIACDDLSGGRFDSGGKTRVISFGSVHPMAPDALEELDRIKEAGLKGIKLHPEYQDFFADDEKVFPIYEKAAALGLITVFHAGMDLGYLDPVHCTPERLARALSVFRGSPVVAAHFGGYLLWHDVEKHLVGKDVYFDTSFCFGRLPRRLGERIVRNHGANRILFGSDMPWSDISGELKLVESLSLGDEGKEMIRGGNAGKLLGF